MPNRITINDVAQRAGVSLMTVSRVINNKDGVNEETRKYIEQIIEELGYKPSSIARSLVTQRTATLGLVVPDIANPYFSGIAHGVSEVAYTEGYSVLLCDAEENPQRELFLLEVLEEKQVDGLVVCAPRLQSDELCQALRQQANVILVNRELATESDTPAWGCVLNDDQEGGRLATGHLLQRGHNCIGLLAGPVASFGSQRRMAGYKESLEEAGLPYQPDLVTHCSPVVEGGKTKAKLLLEKHPEITGMFCHNDMIAIGALQAARSLGRHVPDDLEIVGYDDIPIAAWVSPPLTTIRVAFVEMGRLAIRALINCLEGSNQGCERIVLQPKLVIRGSSP
jgi:LacI family transcriptional regulator